MLAPEEEDNDAEEVYRYVNYFDNKTTVGNHRFRDNKQCRNGVRVGDAYEHVPPSSPELLRTFFAFLRIIDMQTVYFNIEGGSQKTALFNMEGHDFRCVPNLPFFYRLFLIQPHCHSCIHLPTLPPNASTLRLPQCFAHVCALILSTAYMLVRRLCSICGVLTGDDGHFTFKVKLRTTLYTHTRAPSRARWSYRRACG